MASEQLKVRGQTLDWVHWVELLTRELAERYGRQSSGGESPRSVTCDSA